jgi:hypothetical protein
MADPIASRYVARDFFAYNTIHSAIPVSGSNTQVININADSDFQIEKLTFWADTALQSQTADTRFLPFATVLIIDTGSGRQFTDQPIPITSLFGTGEIPFVLKQPKILSARTSVSVLVANLDTANQIDVRLSFIGSKLFLRN